MQTWGIKLGSYGSAVEFCENHGIVGVGWEMFSPGDDELPPRLRRFCQDVEINDYVIYYNPRKKTFSLCRVLGEAQHRDFDLDNDIDIWNYRKVRKIKEINYLDFPGLLKWSVLGPRMSFWRIENSDAEKNYADCLAHDKDFFERENKEFNEIFVKIKEIVLKKMQDLQEGDFEKLLFDLMEFQGIKCSCDVGKSQAIIDVYGTGPFGQKWYGQAKKRLGKKASGNEVRKFVAAVDDNYGIFASFDGFDEEAQKVAGEHENILLLDKEDFVDLILSGKISDDLKIRLKLSI